MLSANITLASNGSQLIGVGPVSRAMGGTGIANPQSSVSALYNNPAGMTLFKNARIDLSGTLKYDDSAALNKTSAPEYSNNREKWSLSPSFGFVFPINKKFHFGIGFIETASLLLDYSDTSFGNVAWINSSGLYTMRLKQRDIIPAVSFKVSESFTLGLSLPITIQSLDFGGSKTTAMGLSAKLGFLWDLEYFRFGGYYKLGGLIAPDHKSVAPNPDGKDLEYTPPTELGLGLSLVFIKNLVFSADVKRIFWSDATGYNNGFSGTASSTNRHLCMEWDNQWVFAFGLQYIINKITLRAGFNYGTDYHSDTTAVAIWKVKYHYTFGFGIQLSKMLVLNSAFMFTTKERADHEGFNTWKTKHREYSADIGLSLIFN